jgi:glutamate-ammonia-ligase adenylyltransferase
MTIEDRIVDRIRRSSLETADPTRAERNLERLFESAHKGIEGIEQFIDPTALLFAASQFLANFCSTYPDELLTAFATIDTPLTKSLAARHAREEFALEEDMDSREFMKRLRLFKKRLLLLVTLRDLLGKTDTIGAMDELTVLSEVALETALAYCMRANVLRFGAPPGDGAVLSLIAFGKLGGEEINYSSDVDLMAVYPDGQGETSGVVGPTGVRMGRITAHEFYSRVMEQFNKVLSANTDEGVAYRVDLRLRPQGQKGDIVMPLSAYRAYYESWGRTWERMTLIRARHVAGDADLGRAFIQVIEPFVWRASADYSDLEEIRALKKKIDSTYVRDDIKRGYGGIREAEFFVHTFQLLYGGGHPELRTHRFLDAAALLAKIKLVPQQEVRDLNESYLYLRRVEHFLQMKDDLQTYVLPGNAVELDALGRLMGFPDRREFLSDLRVKRMKIKNMYNSLLGTKEDIHTEALNLLEGDLSENELKGYLAFRRVRDPENCTNNLRRIRQQFDVPRTQGERTAMRRVIPGLLEMTLDSESPDRAISGLESFFQKHGVREAYLTALTEEQFLTRGMIQMFALSPFLTRLFLSRKRYLNTLVEEMPIRKSARRMREELARELMRGKPKKSAIQGRLMRYKAVEWLRMGMYFLSGVFTAYDLQRYLSHLADALVEAAVAEAGAMDGLAVVALGKQGGRELTYNSDLDLLFISGGQGGMSAAEHILRILSAYTEQGKLYDIDMRLRPDGSKGVLVKELEGYRQYYLEKAGFWEVQALTKARFIAGDKALGQQFVCMAREAMAARGGDVTWDDIRTMRGRIMEERWKKSSGTDVKVGPGGMEDIEFFVQWNQLGAASREQWGLLVQDTVCALGRLFRGGIISTDAYKALESAYLFYIRVKTFLRLNEESVIVPGGETERLLPQFMGHSGENALDTFMAELEAYREAVLRYAQP